MANTDKQNFRYDGDRWRVAVAKAAEMRRDGYDIDMTKLLGREVDRFLNETDRATAERLGLERYDEPVPAYRRPYRRTEDLF